MTLFMMLVLAEAYITLATVPTNSKTAMMLITPAFCNVNKAMYTQTIINEHLAAYTHHGIDNVVSTIVHSNECKSVVRKHIHTCIHP